MKTKKFVIHYSDKNFIRRCDIVYAPNAATVLYHYKNYTSIGLSDFNLSAAGEVNNTSYIHFATMSLRGCNLSNAVLRDLDFSGVDFSEAILEKADFTYSSMRGCILKGAQCNYANFFEVDFSGAILDYADFSFSNCDFAVFKGASMYSANFFNTTCYCSNMRGSEK